MRGDASRFCQNTPCTEPFPAPAMDSIHSVCYHRDERIRGGECAVKEIRPRTKERLKYGLQKGIMGMTVLAMTMVTFASMGTGTTVQAEETLPMPQRDGRVVLYVSDQANLGLKDDMAPYIDQINYAFALIEDGEASGRHWQGITQAERFVKKHRHIDGVLAVGGWGAEGFSDACATKEGRTKLADSILKLMDKHGFVGVDIDWEYPGSSAAGIKSSETDVENWYELLKTLREGLDQREQEQGREFLLSVALGAGKQQLDSVDGAVLNKWVDQAVVMAYDLKGFDRKTGHHAGLYPDGKTPDSGAYAVQMLTDSGLAAEKVLLGIPAYGRMWRQVMGGGNGLNVHAATAGNKVLRYDELEQLVSSGYRRYYDDKAQAAWWYNGENFVSGEDEQSLRAKADYLKAKELMGAAVWAQQHDPQGRLLAELDAALTGYRGEEEAQEEGD